MTVPGIKRILQTPELKILKNIFVENHFAIRIVGGAVRDLLLNKNVQDIDLATDATPEKVCDMLSKKDIRVVMTGLQHGTVTAVFKNKINKHFEITTLRTDKVTDGRHAVVEYINDWKLDALRRDLTINAMSICLDSGEIFDYFSGRAHLESGLVLFVGDPKSRIQEDYLRILRYFRFLDRYSGREKLGRLVGCFGNKNKNENKFEDEMYETCLIIKECVGGLAKISSERKWQEISKMLSAGENMDIVFNLMGECNVLDYCFLNKSKNSKFIDLYKKCKENNVLYEMHPCTLLSVFFDNTKQIEEFFAKMKLSRLERNIFLFLINNQTDMENNDLSYYKGVFFRSMSSAKNIEEIAHCKYHTEQLILLETADKNLKEEFNCWDVPAFPLSGNDLNFFTDIPKKKYSQIINFAKDKFCESNYSFTKQELIAIISENLHLFK